MKKTLIALLAMVGTAFGADTISATWTEPPVWGGGNYAATGYTFSFTLTDDYSITESGSVLGAYWGSDATSTKGANALYLTEADGALTLNVGVGALSDTNMDANTTFTPSITSADTMSVEKGVTYQLSAWAISSNVSYYTILADGNNTGISLVSYNSTMDGTKDAPINYAVNKGSVAGSGAVPEPTTATLSLLALAGLAVRRRRK